MIGVKNDTLHVEAMTPTRGVIDRFTTDGRGFLREPRPISMVVLVPVDGS